jgi:Flp pilus assembly protein TadD
MRGADLRAARERLGATHQQIAESTGVRTSEVEAWEFFGEVPRKHRFAVDLALWELECHQALTKSGLPECEQTREWKRRPWEVKAADVERHMAECPACEARGAYVNEHVRQTPIGGSPMMRLFGVADRLSGWMRSAFLGAMVLLMIGGTGVLLMLGRALLRQDPTYFGYAGGLFALLVVSGAAGGIMHYLTRPLRQKGTLGHYASYVLTVQAYLLTVFGIFTLVAFFLGEAKVAEADLPTATGVADWAILLVMGVVFGIALGYGTRDKGTTTARSQQHVFSLRNIAIGLMFVVGIGSKFLLRQAGPTTPEQLEAALPELKAAVQERPHDLDAQRELAWALLDLKRWDEARPVLREALRLDSGNSDLLNSLGWVELQAGDVMEAAPLFQRAIALDPKNSRAHYNLAWAFYRLGRFEEADSAYRAIIRANPGAASAHAGLGWVLIETRHLKDAEQEFREALRLDSSDAWYHRGLAVALMQNGRPQDALAAFRTATRLTPDDAELWSDIGRLAHFAGKFEESAAAFERANELDPMLFADFPEAKGMWEASRRGLPYVPAGR